MTNKNTMRPAFSSGEVLLALALIALAAGVVGRFAVSINQGIRQREMADDIGWALESARTEVASWNVDEITPENIATRLAVPEGLNERLEQARWVAEVQDVEIPRPSKRVSLDFHSLYQSQPIRPAGLVFWVLKDDVENGQDAGGQESEQGVGDGDA